MSLGGLLAEWEDFPTLGLPLHRRRVKQAVVVVVLVVERTRCWEQC